MIKMAAMPINGKNMKKIFLSVTKRLMTVKGDMQHWVLVYYQDCSNDDWVDRDLFYGKVKFCPLWEEGKTIDFSETIVVYDIKVARYSQLNVYMKLVSTKGQGHSLTLVQISQIQYF